MKSLGRWIILGFVTLALYGALRPILITGTNASDTLLKAGVPIAIGGAVIIGILMAISGFFKGK